MQKSLIYRNRIILGGLVLLVSACAPLRGFLPSHKSNVAPSRSVIAAQEQGLLGNNISALSAAERKQALIAEYQALEHKKTGEAVQWGSAGGARASGSVTPGQPYRVGAQNCRQYSHSWVIGGVPHTVRGSACRNEDGSWTPLV